MFVSEQAKALFTLKGNVEAVKYLGYHVTVEGQVDEAANTIEITKVTTLDYEGAACARPKKVNF